VASEGVEAAGVASGEAKAAGGAEALGAAGEAAGFLSDSDPADASGSLVSDMLFFRSFKTVVAVYR
jgi:hypothetical protein